MSLSNKIKSAFIAAKKSIITVCACILAFAVVIAILFTSIYIPASVDDAIFGKSVGRDKKSGELRPDDRAPQGMQLACENDALAVFYNETESKFALLDKKTENFWNSNPLNYDKDSIATGSLIDRMCSAVEIKYYNSDDALTTLNTYKYSVQNDSVKYELIENGFRIIYQMGDDKITRTMLPAVVEKDKFEDRILSKLSENEKSIVSQFYKLQSISTMTSAVTASTYKDLYTQINDNKEYYFLDQYTPEYKLESLYKAVCVTAEYTAEDVKQDNEKVGYNVTVDTFVRFVIPVEYTLSDDSFVVSIPASEIESPAGLYLTEIILLPFFGSAGLEDKGYMFVPDGSGALVNFNNGRKSSYSYTVPVYGNDKAIRENEASFNTARANIPVFGIVYENQKAMLAIIEEGESHAVINTQISGIDNEQNFIYASFNLLSMDVEEVSDAKFDVSSNLYQQEPYGGRFTIRYCFTGAEEADYASLACIYRDYLRKAGILKKSEEKAQLSLSLTAKIEKEASFVGIPYNAGETVTTLKQAKKITEELKKLGVTDINLGYSSWFNGGLSSSAITGKVSLSGGLGGKSGIKSLKTELGDSSKLSMGADLISVYSSFPKFNHFNNAVRFLNNEIAVGHFYDLATWQPSDRQNDFYYLSSRYFDSVMSRYTKSVNKLGVDGLWLGDVGNTLASDFKPNKNIDREESKRLITETLALVAKDNSVTINNPDFYVWDYLSNAVNLPVKSSENILVNRSVPFLQIVLSGSTRYSGGPFNRSGSDDENFLNAVETGADLYYEWIYKSDVEISSLKGVDSEKLYSMCYKGWINTAAEQYKRIYNELGAVSGHEITGHSKLLENVYLTQYNDASVIVNYNYNDVEVNGITVKARDFKLLKGEGK